ncbi:MAG: enoyl-CoA hydratase/isomerase family protein [Chromatiales bacterium]|nr:enoyl-CoA hydratase/isomerase family protein [Chromatiales bacterium]
MTTPVLVDVEDGIGTVTLNRPEKLNAWDSPMREQVRAALESMNADAAVRAIVITGAGDRAFSAGQDLAETQAFTSGEDALRWFLSWRAFYDAVRGLDKGCVAALNGVAAGSAYQFAMLTDVRVGHPGTRMGQPEINSGIPSVLGPMLMLPRIGLSRTIELTLTGRMMDGEECHHIGLVHHLVPADQVMARAREVARDLASKPPLAMRLNKRRFREMTQRDFDEAFEAGQAIESEAFEAGEPQKEMERFFAERAARR